ncbi:MAG: ATP-binding protein [Rhodoferax sp.]|nr:ATP-binding protein [Rhodoferax sp.]
MVTGFSKNKRYLLWLAVGTGVLALAMAVLLALQLTQKRAIEAANDLRADSITALVFQFEREFLRFRQAVEASVIRPGAPDQDTLTLRYDLFLSRMTLMRDNPTTELIAHKAEYQTLLPHMDTLIAQTDAVMASPQLKKSDLAVLLTELNAIGVEVQALSVAANSEVAALLERQARTMLQQNNHIIRLIAAQLVFLLLASGALALRQRWQEKERQALEDLTHKLREAHFRAEAANRGKSQFLANMSHELRTPFNGMLGMMSLLESSPLTSAQMDYIRTAKGSATHLLSLLNDILDVSALESGKMALAPAPVQLSALLQEVNALMQPLAVEKKLQFSVAVHGDLPPWVHADATRLKQILFNLFNNALKFTEQGKVTLTVSPVATGDDRPTYAFVLEDTGIGMDHEVLSKLFQRFYQVDGGLARKFGGTGLGLEISQNLARMMGGHVDVTSTPGKGSVFTLQVPFTVYDPPAGSEHCAHAPGLTPLPPAMLRAPAPPGTPPEQALQGLRVLVAEDHPVNRKFVAILLDKMGCVSTFCENGQLAVDAARSGVFDLVLMDVHMPIMDGLTATRILRSMPGAMGSVPIIVLTADVMNDAKEQALAAGVNDFVSKPVQMAQLQGVILQCLAKAHATASHAPPQTQQTMA